jgi:hypothetical protein
LSWFVARSTRAAGHAATIYAFTLCPPLGVTTHTSDPAPVVLTKGMTHLAFFACWAIGSEPFVGSACVLWEMGGQHASPSLSC